MDIIKNLCFKLPVLLFSLVTIACNGYAQSSSLETQDSNSALTDLTRINPLRKYETAALIYAGDSTATGDPEAIESILDSHGVSYQVASSQDMNAMSLEDFSKFGMIIWPGGYAGYMSASLLPSTRNNIRLAVTEQGVGYVGICAGAFIAISPPPEKGSDGPDWGLSILPGDLLPYYHLEDEGTEDAMVDIQLADHSTRSMLWWGGPYLPASEFPNGVIARYSDTAEPAIAQKWSGKGLVILSGPHPESPQEWRDKLGLIDRDGLDQDVAWDLFHAALTGTPLPTIQ